MAGGPGARKKTPLTTLPQSLQTGLLKPVESFFQCLFARFVRERNGDEKQASFSLFYTIELLQGSNVFNAFAMCEVATHVLLRRKELMSEVNSETIVFRFLFM